MQLNSPTTSVCFTRFSHNKLFTLNCCFTNFGKRKTTEMILKKLQTFPSGDKLYIKKINRCKATF